MAQYGSLPFAERIDYFNRKIPVPTARWNDLQREMHDAGFMVAGAMQADLLADLQGAVGQAIAEGRTLREFTKDFEAIVAKHGWTGWTGEKTKAGRAWRARVIYETNLRTSYQAGRWEQIQAGKKRRPYLQYKHSHAVVTPRELHVSWDGLVVPVDSEWVKTHWPPLGYGCQCTMLALSERDLRKLGKTGPDTPPDDGTYEWVDKVTGEVHTFPNGIQPFWDYAPGASAAAIVKEQAERKAKGLPADIGEALAELLAGGPTARYERVAQSLGIAAVDYAGRPDIGAAANAAFVEFAGRGLPLPDVARVSDAYFQRLSPNIGVDIADIAGAFTSKLSTGEAYLLLNPFYRNWFDLPADAKAQYANKEWSSPSASHILRHELAHLAHYRAAAEIYKAARDYRFTDAERIITKRVSKYAADSGAEFVAEVFAGRFYGQEYDKEVLALYQRLGGPGL